MSDVANSEEVQDPIVAPFDGENPKYERVSFEDVSDSLAEADQGADDREDMPVSWFDVIPTPAQALHIGSFKIGQRFELELGQHDAQLEVAEIEDRGKTPDFGGPTGPNKQCQFVVVFRGHSRRALVPEGIYRLRNDELGEFEIYLRPVPGDTNQNQTQHQLAPHLMAIFS